MKMLSQYSTIEEVLGDAISEGLVRPAPKRIEMNHALKLKDSILAALASGPVSRQDLMRSTRGDNHAAEYNLVLKRLISDGRITPQASPRVGRGRATTYFNLVRSVDGDAS